jgi:hypothetical protein
MNELFLMVLGEIYEEQPALFGINFQDIGDLPDKFNVFRSLRRGSESRAVAMKVSKADRYVVNRREKRSPLEQTERRMRLTSITSTSPW